MRSIRRPLSATPGSVLSGFAIAVLAWPLCARAAGPEDRQAYFGETHVHTSWSLDAFSIGNTLTNPSDA
jgi:hypothetical protein